MRIGIASVMKREKSIPKGSQVQSFPDRAMQNTKEGGTIKVTHVLSLVLSRSSFDSIISELPSIPFA